MFELLYRKLYVEHTIKDTYLPYSLVLFSGFSSEALDIRNGLIQNRGKKTMRIHRGGRRKLLLGNLYP